MNEILQECCMVFWKKGYTQTSLKDIEKATGLNPGSVYHLFQDKEALFGKVMEHYMHTIVMPRLKQFLQTDEGDAYTNIRTVFDSIVEVPCDYRWIGCLMTNASVEVQNMPEIKEKIQEVFDLFEQGFLHQINRIPSLKKRSLKDRKKLAGNLLVAMEGFFVLVRLQNDTERLKRYVDSAIYPLTIAIA